MCPQAQPLFLPLNCLDRPNNFFLCPLSLSAAVSVSVRTVANGICLPAKNLPSLIAHPRYPAYGIKENNLPDVRPLHLVDAAGFFITLPGGERLL